VTAVHDPAAVARRAPNPPAPIWDVERIRRDFPILRRLIRGKPLIYLDNAATSQKPEPVLSEIGRYFREYNANVHRAAHRLSTEATEAFEGARGKLQRFLNAAESREIVFTRGTTEAINLVAASWGGANLKAGDEVLVTAMEHHSNIVPWQLICQRTGAKLRAAPVNDRGELLFEEFVKLLGQRTRMVAFAHVSNALGTINPAAEMIAAAHAAGAVVLVDGAQAVPHMRVDVRALDADFYCFSSHKLYGPTGIGALFGKAALLEAMPPYQGGGDMIKTVTFDKTVYADPPNKFEAGTPHIAGAIGFGAAIDYVEGVGCDAIGAWEHSLLRRATEKLSEVRGLRIIGTAEQKAAVVSFVLDDPPRSALDIGVKLDVEGIAVRTGHHCCMPLMERFGVPGTVRASFAMYNTPAEVDALAAALQAFECRGIFLGAAEKPPPAAAAYPPATAPSPAQAAEAIAEAFEFLGDWPERYRFLIDAGGKLPAMPAELKIEPNRVRGCQSTVYMFPRIRPGTADVFEFLADSDADIVRGELALLQKVFSGQSAAEVAGFDVNAFFARLGLDQNLTMGRRNGLAEMVKRIQGFAGRFAGKKG
jgi:cysteine desulfurase/selenocysteine lyase